MKLRTFKLALLCLAALCPLAASAKPLYITVPRSYGTQEAPVVDMAFAERGPVGRWVRVTVRRLEPPAMGMASLTVRDEFRQRDVSRYEYDDQVRAYGKPVYALRVERLGAADLRHLPIPIDLLRPPVQNVVRN